MKTLLTSLIILTCSLAHADYSATGKTINVIIPNTNSSGLAGVFLDLQNFASKQKITLVPTYKPGARGKIGIDYAAKVSDNQNTLFLATTSDVTENNAVTKFDPVSNICEVKMVLVASKKSNVKHINDIVSKPANKFNWVYSSTPQLNLIKSTIKYTNLDESKMQLIAYTPGIGVPYQTSLIAGDADIGFVNVPVANRLIENNQLTLVELDSLLKKKLDMKVNAVSLFLPKNTSADANKFWQKFISEFLEDDEVKENLKAAGVSALPVGKDNVIKVLDSWVN
jgi:tripartite-type tricarboxylate transporter receptor subunit TctC